MKITTDLWFAAYLSLQGVELTEYEKLNTRKVQFKFNISEEEWAAHKLAFFNSEITKFRQAQERLRDLLY